VENKSNRSFTISVTLLLKMNVPIYPFMLHIFDLDGTLIESYMNPKRPFKRVAALPGRVDVLATLRQHGHTIAIATNQGGVAFGYNTEAEVQDKLMRARAALGLPPDTFVAVCYSDPRSSNPAYNQPMDCARRKPSGAMLREAMAAHPAAAHEGVLYVGDRPEDAQAAQNTGVPFQWEYEFFG
jgi:D-glycero-D-manno-heptose 1,7-bisphosphate phosphatase